MSLSCVVVMFALLSTVTAQTDGCDAVPQYWHDGAATEARIAAR